jgi:hypothetical protein
MRRDLHGIFVASFVASFVDKVWVAGDNPPLGNRGFQAELPLK